jgi:thioredoxin-dependent peroxiredoxin
LLLRRGGVLLLVRKAPAMIPWGSTLHRGRSPSRLRVSKQRPYGTDYRKQHGIESHAYHKGESGMNMFRSKKARMILTVALGLAMLVMVMPALHAALADDNAPMPAVGSVAPDFKLNSQEGTPVSLHDYKGKWVVLYFYPKDQTTGCTIEAHGFQRDLAQYDAKNAVVLGVSVDSVDSHKEFCAKDSLTFKLLSDTSHEVVTKYGSLLSQSRPDGTSVAYAQRNTFLINPKGVIVKVYTKVNPTPHSEQVLADLTEQQSTK